MGMRERKYRVFKLAVTSDCAVLAVPPRTVCAKEKKLLLQKRWPRARVSRLQTFISPKAKTDRSIRNNKTVKTRLQGLY